MSARFARSAAATGLGAAPSWSLAATILVWKSSDGGRSFSVRPINLPATLGLPADDGPSLLTRVLVDPLDRRRLTVLWWAIAKRDVPLAATGLSDYEFATKAFVAASGDAGACAAATATLRVVRARTVTRPRSAPPR